MEMNNGMSNNEQGNGGTLWQCIAVNCWYARDQAQH